MSVRVNITTRMASDAVARTQRRLVVPAMERAVRAGADYARDEITAADRVDRGDMRDGNVGEVSLTGRGVRGRIVNRVPHAKVQHEGVDGPVLPRTARVLRFTPKGGGAVVFRPSTSGFPGVPFLTNALRRLRRSDFAR